MQYAIRQNAILHVHVHVHVHMLMVNVDIFIIKIKFELTDKNTSIHHINSVTA